MDKGPAGLIVELGGDKGRERIIWAVNDDTSAPYSNIIKKHALERIAEALETGDEKACETIWTSNDTFGGFDNPKNKTGYFSRHFVDFLDNVVSFRGGKDVKNDLKGMTRAAKMNLIGKRLRDCYAAWSSIVKV